jgi:hypothetical protein
MRGHYLKPNDYSEHGGCRGGVGSNHDYDDGYELEIGMQCHCSSEMMALAVHYDEIMEYLELYAPKSVVARMLVTSIKKTVEDIDHELKEADQEKRRRDEIRQPPPSDGTYDAAYEDQVSDRSS